MILSFELQRRKKKIIRTILAAIIFVLVIFAGYLYVEIYHGASGGNEKNVAINSGEGVHQISQNLYDQGIIKNKLIFESYLWLRNLGSKIQAGEYILTAGMPIKDLTEIITWGKSQSNERFIKIIEGWTMEDIAAYLDREGADKKEDFLAAANDLKIWSGEKDRWSFLSEIPAGGTLEGFLFPDTYRIMKDASNSDIIKKLLDNFNQKLSPSLLGKIKENKMTVFDTIIMASILEKEMPDNNDRAIAADVLYKRLTVGMPLQVDSSVNYITGKIRPLFLSRTKN